MKIQMALAALPLSIARKYVKKWNKNGIGVKAVRRFLKKGSKGYRLYIPIKPKKTKKVVPPVAILHALQSVGYRIDDYVTGIAVDSTGKRRMRIGKLIKDAELLKEFMNDPQRAAHKDEFTCVISCHPYDVIGMSTGRRWDETSCMRLDVPGKARGGVHKDVVEKDVAEGTIVAYAISPKDTNLQKPHARLLIKPFYKLDKIERDQYNNVVGGKNIDKKAPVYFRVETRLYGTPIPGFQETVAAWLRKVNKDAASGIYKLAEGLYDDGVGHVNVNVDFDKHEDKWGFIKGYLSTLKIKPFLQHDPRWLGVIFENYFKNSTTTNHDYVAGEIADIIDTAVHSLDVKTVVKEIDKHMSEETALYVVEHLIGNKNQKVAEASKVLSKAAHDMYSWENGKPEDGDWQDGDFIFNRVAFHDSRWLSVLFHLTREHAQLAASAFAAGTFKMTKELRESKAPGSVMLRKYVGLMMRVIAEAEKINTDADRIHKLVKQLKMDTYYDEDIYNLMGHSWPRYIQRFITNEAPQGLLCAVDKSWPAADPELVTYGGKAIYEKKAFTNLVSLKNNDINYYLITNVRGVIYDNDEHEWFASHPYVREFIVQAARSSNIDVAGVAKRYTDKWKKRDDDMDNIIKELGLD